MSVFHPFETLAGYVCFDPTRTLAAVAPNTCYAPIFAVCAGAIRSGLDRCAVGICRISVATRYEEQRMALEEYRTPTKVKLAALWAATMFCYVYGDYLSPFASTRAIEM
jgi:hypothetical protein